MVATREIEPAELKDDPDQFLIAITEDKWEIYPPTSSWWQGITRALQTHLISRLITQLHEDARSSNRAVPQIVVHRVA